MSQRRLRRSSRRSIGLTFAPTISTSLGFNPALCCVRVAGALRRVHEDCVPSVEVAIEKLVQAVTSIVRCLAVVFQPVTKYGPAGLKLRVIETVVRAGIHNKLAQWQPGRPQRLYFSSSEPRRMRASGGSARRSFSRRLRSAAEGMFFTSCGSL